jgi:SnoaL-like domain
LPRRTREGTLVATTKEADMSDVTTTVDTYLAMWNEPDAARRSELIARAWTPDGSYVDPMLAAEGHPALSEMVARVHEQFPGYRFTRTSGIDEHNGLVRFAWELGDGNGTVAVAGLDVGELADDGKLRRIAGFFGELPAAA